MPIELQGQLERITYHNEENHYTIAKLKVKGQRDLVTIVGCIVSMTPGEVLRLKGDWDSHPKYGEQFKVVSYETVTPATVKGIERYLGSGLIKGIGPVMAKRLVNKFGLETLEIIENSADRLKEVEGIGEKRIDMISTAWAEQKEVRDVMLFLQGHEVSSNYAAKIYRQYGKESIRVVKENPFRLADDIFGIGFLTADKIAGNLGIPKDSEMRAEAGILYVLRKLADEGHVYYPYEDLINESMKILEIDTGIITSALGKIASEKRVVLDGKAVYLSEFYAAEVGVAVSLKAVLVGAKGLIRSDRDAAIKGAQEELKITLAEKQIQAVRESLDKKVLVITGGPGTGKTTIINAILRIYRRAGQRVLLAAPTGRAAKRMSETTGFEARTIHRLLEFSPKDNCFKKNEQERLDTDLIVIDEASMVDTILMHHLSRAVRPETTLLLVGDIDQLPSVGAGNVLKDIIDSGRVPTVRLNEIFRQAKESMIIINAHRINSGEFPYITSDKEKLRDFYFVELEEPEKVLEMIVHMCRDRIPERFGFHPLDDIQVLTPMHRGVVGASSLNAALQKELNASPEGLQRGGRIFKKGDKVMQIRNNYDKDVYNGDIGRIVSMDKEAQEVTVSFDGKRVDYDFSDLDEIVLAYAVSVHKSQGSEYPVVVMPLLTQHYLLLQRNLLYTAITRGKKLVVIIGTKKALGIAIRNNNQQLRYTRLKDRLIND